MNWRGGGVSPIVMSASAELNRDPLDCGRESSRVSLDASDVHESRYASLFENSHDLILSVRPDGAFEFVNPAWLRTLGYDQAALSDLNLFSVIHPEERDHCLTCFAQVLAGEALHEMQTALIAQDGRRVDVEGSVVPYVQAGQIVAVQGVFRDVSERRRVEASLQKSETWLRAVVEHSTDVIFVLDRDGKIRFASASVAHTLGYQPDELNDLDLLALVHPDDRFQLIQIAELCGLEAGSSMGVECRIQHPDGHWVYLESTLTNLYDQPALQGLLVIAHDITSRKQMQAALEESEERLRSLLASSPDVIYLLDLLSGKTIFINRDTVLGYPRAEVHTFGHILAAAHPDDRVAVEAFWFSLMDRADDHVETLELRLETRQKTWQWTQMRGTVSTRDETDRPREVLITLTDITDRRRIEEELAAYRSRLESLVEERTGQLNRARERVESVLNSSADAIILATPEGRVQQTNPQFNVAFACEIDAYFGRHLAALLHPDSVPALEAALDAVLEHHERQHLEVLAARRDGTAFYADLGLSAVAPSRGAAANGIVCIVRDITQRKQAEAELIKALERERELGELKSRFVSMASHEFRTPLATILASADTLRTYRTRMTPEAIEHRFDKIAAEVQHMTALIEQVLLVGRAEAGRVEFHPETVDVVAFCTELLDHLGRNERAASSAERHILAFQAAGEWVQVRADTRLLRQIVSNLVSNAIKYSPAGSQIDIRLDCTRPESFTLEVQDHGIGIPDADQAHLFEPFHRAANVGTIPGTGLGMNIIRHSVELHGGTITFTSAENAGSTFTVTLPNAVSSDNQVDDPKEQPNDESSGH